MPAIRSLAAILSLAVCGLAPLAAHAQYDRPIGQPLGQTPWGGAPTYGGAPVGGYGGVQGGYGGYGSGYGGQAVVCESHDGGFAECRTPFSGPPAIGRTLSSSACVQGQTWGSRGAGSVWVMGGCRAEFVDAYGGQGGGAVAPYGQGDGTALRCESDQGRQRECQANVATRLTLVRQLSDAACVEGQSWGSDNRGRVWVRYGCRGDFAPAQGWGAGAVPGGSGYGYGYGDGTALRCESDNGRQRECRANVATRLTLVRQLSDAACVEGQTWGSDNRGRVWVRNGCRGDFAPAQGWGGTQAGGAYGYAQGVVCESVERRYNACTWDPRWGRPYLAEQLSGDACQEGRSWGFDGRSQIWVDRGCRGRFSPR